MIHPNAFNFIPEGARERLRAVANGVSYSGLHLHVAYDRELVGLARLFANSMVNGWRVTDYDRHAAALIACWVSPFYFARIDEGLTQRDLVLIHVATTLTADQAPCPDCGGNDCGSVA